MLIENFIIEKLRGNNNSNLGPGGEQQNPDDSQYSHPTRNGGLPSNQKKILLAILNIVLAFIAGYLSWNCNASEKPWIRVIYTIVAGVFSGFYMIYYLVYRVILRVSCGDGSSGSSGSSSSGSSGYGNTSGSSSGYGNTIYD